LQVLRKRSRLSLVRFNTLDATGFEASEALDPGI
jgi:hypothetical protein